MNNAKSFYICFYPLLAIASVLAKWTVENWTIKEMLTGGTALWKPLWELKGLVKVGHVPSEMPFRRVPFQVQVNFLVCSLPVATWVYEMSGHWVCNNAEMG